MVPSLRIATSESTNTVIIQGGRDDVDVAEAIIAKLESIEQQPRPKKGEPQKKPPAK